MIKDNARILNSHFHSLFNSEVEVDMTVLEELPQYEVKQELGEAPTHAEVMSTIKSMAYDKAPGQSKLTTDMIKNLPPSALDLYTEIIQEFWKNERVDLNSWHTTILNTIYKGKGDPQDPNNRRGIALKETPVKVLSIVIAKHLLSRLKAVNPKKHFTQ